MIANRRLKQIASVRVSNVDKKSVDGERPVQLCNYTDVYYNDRIIRDMPFMEATAPDDQVARFSLCAGDILITKDSETADDIAVPAYVTEDMPGVLCGYHLAIIHPRPQADGRYLFWALASRSSREQFAALATGVTRFGLRYEAFGDVLVPLPSLVTQRAIADHLDAETVRIDALIQKKRRMVRLLAGRVRAARETLVSEGWRSGSTSRLGHLLHEVDNRLGPANAPPLLSVSIHRGVIPFAEANPDRVARADDVANYKRCRRDDIVLNRMRAFQGGIGRATTDGIVSPDYAVLRPSARGLAEYLNHLMRSPWFVGQMERLLRGIGSADQGCVRTPRVNWDDLRTVVVPLPPLQTRRQLAAQLDAALNDSWEVQRAIERQVALLQEHRQALITAAVIGELDIPRVAA